MIDWEDILSEFLTGDVMRADVEALRWKIQLPPEARMVVDRDLQLVDDLAAIGANMTPADGQTDKALDRALTAIRQIGKFVTPAHWKWVDGIPSVATAEPAVDAQDTALADRLADLGRSIPIPSQAMARALSRIEETPMSGELREAAGTGDNSMRLFPAGAEQQTDVLAASDETLPIEPSSTLEAPDGIDDDDEEQEHK